MHDSIAAVVACGYQNTILSIELELFVFILPCGEIKVHNDFLRHHFL